MSLDKSYLKYPLRRHGMDHDIYPWSNMFERKKVTWPGGARIALWIVPALEYFPLDVKSEPFKAPGHMVTPYPDYRTYTTRDYGTRIGIFRIMKVLDTFGLKASFATNARIAERHPFLIEEIVRRNWEVIAHGYDMNTLHYGGMDKAVETENIQQTLEILRQSSGQAVTGWLSPASSESENTLDLLPDHGIDYICDWVNDDMPYQMAIKNSALLTMPHSNELNDRQISVNYHHPEEVFEEQIIDAFNSLYKESETHGGRIMAITLTPYIIGLPYRIKSLAKVLDHITGHDGVWSATGAEIAATWKAQQ